MQPRRGVKLHIDYLDIENKLQYRFNDRSLLRQAFIHSSYANVENLQDNERMEFLGDAIMDMVVSEYFYGAFPDRDAGELSVMRSNVVSADALRPIVDGMDLMKYLQVSNGSKQIKSLSKKIESNLFEAIVCAIYLDGGLDAARSFLLRVIKSALDDAVTVSRKDDKTLLQEYCQKNRLPVPQYKLMERKGSDNDPSYKYGLYIQGELVACGEGNNKKSAEQDAAKKIVTKWRIK